ncbi:hypothetical protein CR513_09493, partial [Mucuna pruriens]
MAESMHFSTSKDKNSVMASICYFRVIEEIWEVDYTKFRVLWVDNNMSVQTDELGFTLVNLDKGEPFIMVSHAKQVFYVNDLLNKRLVVVLQQGNMNGGEENQDISLDLTNSPSFSTHMPTFNDGNEIDDVHATCHDHIEGPWENILCLEIGYPSKGTFGAFESTQKKDGPHD